MSPAKSPSFTRDGILHKRGRCINKSRAQKTACSSYHLQIMGAGNFFITSHHELVPSIHQISLGLSNVNKPASTILLLLDTNLPIVKEPKGIIEGYSAHGKSSPNNNKGIQCLHRKAHTISVLLSLSQSRQQ